jgi:hypothetical protein
MENRIVKIVRLNLSNWIVFSRDQPGMLYVESELDEILSKYLTAGELVGVMHEVLKMHYGQAIELRASL